MKVKLLILVEGKKVFESRTISLLGDPEKAVKLAKRLGGRAAYEPISTLLAANFISQTVAKNFYEYLKKF